jgi:hypothetical protein
MASYFRKVPNFEYVSRNKGEQNISDYVEVKNLFKKGKIREDIFGNLAFFEKYQIIGDDRPDNVAFKLYEDETLDWVVLLSNNILNIQTEWPLSQDVFDSVMLERYGSYDNLYSGVHHYETVEIKNSLGKTVLPSGIRTPLSWKTNGNFLEIINSKIDTLVGSASTTSVTVTMSNGILGLEENDQVTIDGVAEKQYNGQYIVTGITSISSDIVYGFTYDLPSIPSVISPTLSTPRKEEVHYTVSEESLNPGNSYYYEYWDEGLGYSVQVPSTAFVREVTNYEYELEINEAKRGIYVLKAKYLNVLFNDIDTIMPYKKGGTQYVSATLKRADNIKLYE